MKDRYDLKDGYATFKWKDVESIEEDGSTEDIMAAH